MFFQTETLPNPSCIAAITSPRARSVKTLVAPRSVQNNYSRATMRKTKALDKCLTAPVEGLRGQLPPISGRNVISLGIACPPAISTHWYSYRMPQPLPRSPFQDGFAALWHEPALFAAELTWRWCFGLAAWGLAIISVALFLESLKISRDDEFLLGTLQPQLLHGAVRHIFRGSLNRFLCEQAVLILGLMLLWALAATAGRAATLRRLVAMFSADEEPQAMRWEFEPIFALNLLRAMWSLIALTAMLVSLVAGIIMAHNQRAATAAFFLAFGIGLAWAFGVVLNWFFGLAPLFCIRNGAGAAEALTQSVDFSSGQAGRLFGLGLTFGLLRLVWAGTMFLIFLAPLRLEQHVARGWIALLMAIVALVYFAGTDFLYLARLGAYVALAEDDAYLQMHGEDLAGPAPLTDATTAIAPPYLASVGQLKPLFYLFHLGD